MTTLDRLASHEELLSLMDLDGFVDANLTRIRSILQANDRVLRGHFDECGDLSPRHEGAYTVGFVESASIDGDMEVKGVFGGMTVPTGAADGGILRVTGVWG